MTFKGVKKPLQHCFLIGTHRSGTTWLGGLLGDLPGVAYWSEPRQVWSYGNWSRPDDYLSANECTPEIARHIRRRFDRFARARSAEFFVEKTPSNCLRVHFVRAVFPKAKFILLLRDGRAVLRSTDEIQARGPDWSRIFQRARETSWRELPAYFDRWRWVVNKFTGRPMRQWGVRPQGWDRWGDDLSSTQRIARQWSESVLAAYEAIQMLPADQGLVIRYEDLIREPRRVVQQVIDFAGLPNSETTLVRAEASVTADSLTKWSEQLEPKVLAEARPILQPALESLGYRW